MRKATINPRETGFTLNPRRSRRHPATTITDADFADDIALLSDTIEKAQLLLLRVEVAAESIGLHVNEKKTEYITYNQVESEIITLTGTQLKCVAISNILDRGSAHLERTWTPESDWHGQQQTRWISSGSQP